MLTPGDALPVAQLALGILDFRDDASPDRQSASVAWLRNAADQGSAEAAYMVGLAHGVGRGVEKNDAASDRWLLVAAGRGHVKSRAIMVAGYLEKADYAKALAMLGPAAEAGDPDAQRDMAAMCTNGAGVKKDDAEAVKWATRSAEQGDSEAMRLAGFVPCCAQPRMIPEDLAESATWCLLAASAGSERGAGVFAELGAFLSPAQMAQARSRATAWIAAHPGAGIKTLVVAEPVATDATPAPP